MSVSSLFDINNKAYQAESIRIYDLYVDGTAHGITGGSISPGPANTFFRTTNLLQTQWDPFSLQYIPEGVTGTVLRSGVTGGTGTIHWGNIELQDIPGSGVTGQVLVSFGDNVAWATIQIFPFSLAPGDPLQTYRTNATGSAVEWTDDLHANGNCTVQGSLGVTGASTFVGNGLFKNDLAVDNDMNVINGDLVVGNGQLQVLVGSSTLQDTDIDGNLTFNSSSGVTGNVLIKTSPTTQDWSDLAPSDIKGGTQYQILQSDGTNGGWVTDVTLPGNLVLQNPSVAILDQCTIYSILKLGGFAGGLGSVCVANGSSVPHWEYPQYFAQYYQNGPVVDMNGAATVLLLQSAGVNVPNSNISYLAGVFTVTEGGNYILTFETIASTSAAKTQVNFRINGTFLGSTSNIYIPALTESQPLLLQKTYRLAPGTTIEVVSEPIVAGVVNTSLPDSNGVATTMLTIQRIGAYV